MLAFTTHIVFHPCSRPSMIELIQICRQLLATGGGSGDADNSSGAFAVSAEAMDALGSLVAGLKAAKARGALLAETEARELMFLALDALVRYPGTFLHAAERLLCFSRASRIPVQSF